MLSEIRIKNFKSLRDTGTLEIKPMTILIGPNSSGKSSVIQFLLMIKQTAESRDYLNPLIFNEACIKLESYRNIIWRNNIKLPLEFEFSLSKRESRGFPPISPRAKYHVVFYRKRGNAAGVDSFKITDKKSEKVILSIRLDKRSVRPKIILEDSMFSRDIEKNLKENIRFFKFYPVNLFMLQQEYKESDKWIKNAITYTEFLDFYFQDICYLGPLREFPQRYYPVSGATLKDVGFKGERAIEILTGRREIAQNVRKWIKKFELAEDVEVRHLRKRTLAEVILKDKKLGLNINLYDVGFGISQILPIIVEGFYAKKGSLLIIEQPEIHLHPKLQADIGDLLIEITKLEKDIIIETHSEHLLLRIKRRIAEGSLHAEDVAIYYFNLTPEGTQIKKIKIDKSGRFENWPEGFFEEDIKETLAITKAYMKNMRKNSR